MARTLIRGAKICDGTGTRPFIGDVLISGEKIEKVAPFIRNAAYDRLVEADGLVLSPGFINTHSHMELQMFRDPTMQMVVGQGITTETLGQDGSSVAPIDDAHVEELAENMSPLAGLIDKPYWWRGFADYMQKIEDVHPACRFVGMIGHGTVRMSVIGSENRPLTPEELKKVCDIIERCMEEGARGVTFGMIYPPSSYADLEELVAVSKAVAKHDGLIMVHTRNEMTKLEESFEEFVTVMKRSGVRLQISHLKSLGPHTWGTVLKLVDRIAELQKEGWDITFDQYPWTAGGTGMKVIVPQWAYAGGEDAFHERLHDPETYQKILEGTRKILYDRGDGERVQISTVPGVEEWQWMAGLYLNEVAKRLGFDDEAAAVLYILEKTRSSVICIYHAISENDVRAVMRSPYHCVCTDGILGAVPHPRCFSTYHRFLGRYVRELGIMPLETAIQHITSEPARRLRLYDRGLIREGMSADLTLFDFDTIYDLNSYEDPRKPSVGIKKVWVKGTLQFEGE